MVVDLLDPSPFSLAEARGVLSAPFAAADDLQIGVEQLDTGRWPYDAAWAVHALYAVPPDLLGEGLRRMSAVIRPGGLGMVAQATSHSHYLRMYEAYRAAHAPGATPFTTAENVADELWALGADLDMEILTYRTTSDDARGGGGVPPAVPVRRHDHAGPDARARARAAISSPPTSRGAATATRWTFAHEVFLLTWTPGAN